MRQKNIIAAAVLIVLIVIYGIMTAFLPVRTLPNTPDPSFFPWINTVVILVLSVWLLLRGLGQPHSDPVRGNFGGRKRALGAMGSFLVYLVALPGLGFVLATVPFFAVMMTLFGERRPFQVTCGAVGMTFALYLLFRHAFGIFLPRGLLAGVIT